MQGPATARDLPPEFGAWQTVHRRHQEWSQDSIWDKVLASVQAQADAAGELDWDASVDRMDDWRGLATRYDEYATVYRGGVVLAAILDWLR